MNDDWDYIIKCVLLFTALYFLLHIAFFLVTF